MKIPQTFVSPLVKLNRGWVNGTVESLLVINLTSLLILRKTLNKMTNLSKIKSEAIKRFESEFCNNHQKPIRFLRSVFYDEQDGAEQIETFLLSEIDRAVTEAKLEAAEEIWQAIDAEFESFKIDVAMRPIITKYKDDLLQKLSTLKEK